MSEYEFKRIAESGDLVLFETDNIGALVQRKITNSNYDHVGLVVKF
jgi:palmitoyltransferase